MKVGKYCSHSSATIPAKCGAKGTIFARKITNQLGSGRGAEQRHGRPPNSQGVPDKAQLKKKRLFGRAKRRHGRPLGSKGLTTISPPSAIALKESSTLPVGVTVHNSTGGTVTGTSKPGSAASAAKHDETSMKSPVPHTLNLSWTPLPFTFTGTQKTCL